MGGKTLRSVEKCGREKRGREKRGREKRGRELLACRSNPQLVPWLQLVSPAPSCTASALSSLTSNSRASPRSIGVGDSSLVKIKSEPFPPRATLSASSRYVTSTDCFCLPGVRLGATTRVKPNPGTSVFTSNTTRRKSTSTRLSFVFGKPTALTLPSGATARSATTRAVAEARFHGCRTVAWFSKRSCARSIGWYTGPSLKPAGSLVRRVISPAVE